MHNLHKTLVKPLIPSMFFILIPFILIFFFNKLTQASFQFGKEKKLNEKKTMEIHIKL